MQGTRSSRADELGNPFIVGGGRLLPSSLLTCRPPVRAGDDLCGGTRPPASVDGLGQPAGATNPDELLLLDPDRHAHLLLSVR